MARARTAPAKRQKAGFLDKVMEPVENSAREITEFHAELGDPNAKSLLG